MHRALDMQLIVNPKLTEAPNSKPSKKQTSKSGVNKKRIRYFHGIGPQWIFRDEKYFCKWERNQVKYLKELDELTQKRKAYQNVDYDYLHNKILCMVGPEWFQELSVQQKTTIDNLEACMKFDIEWGITKSVKCNMSQLGLRPLPNPSQIRRALKQSYGCPIEFLLVLYQLIKPNRRTYSINDRLLLSGVVHLTLPDTLREMHVRFPSPPRKPKKCCPPTLKIRKKYYESVYLKPFSFVREKPKHLGIYKDPWVQRPNSQYFSYYKELNSQLERSNLVVEDEKIPCELFYEHKRAEKYYNELFQRDVYLSLLRPRMYEPCAPMFFKKPKRPLKLKQYEMAVEIKFYSDQEADKKIECSVECRATPVTENSKVIAKYTYVQNLDEYLKGEQKSSSDIAKAKDRPVCNCVPTKFPDENSGCPFTCQKPVPGPPQIMQSFEVIPMKVPKSSKRTSRLLIVKDDYGLKGTCCCRLEGTSSPFKDTSKPENDDFCRLETEKLLKSLKCPCPLCVSYRNKLKNRNMILGNVYTDPDKGTTTPVVIGTTGKPGLEPCDCLHKFRQQIRDMSEYEKRTKAKLELMEQKQKYVLGGVTRDRQGQPVYNISSVVPKRPCTCNDDTNRNVINSKGVNRPVLGVKQGSKENVLILGDTEVSVQPKCECDKIYQNFLEQHNICLNEYDRFLKNMQKDIDEYMREMKTRYSSDDSPVMEEKLIAKEREKIPDMKPPIRPPRADNVRFVISGVKVTHRGKVFMLGGTRQDEDGETSGRCSCSNIETKDEHVCEAKSICEEDAVAVIHEISYPDPLKSESCECLGNNATTLGPNRNYFCNYVTTTMANENIPENFDFNKYQRKYSEPNIINYWNTGADGKPKVYQCYRVEVPTKKVPSIYENCAAKDEDYEIQDKKIGPQKIAEGNARTINLENSNFKRYIILKRIPLKQSSQVKIIKKLLAGLAEDGYPLAKLPECYRLPHFLLWMNYRNKKVWRSEDKYPNYIESTKLWNHINICRRKVRLSKFKMSDYKLQRLTWRQAGLVKALVKDLKSRYYNQARRANVDFARETLPTFYYYRYSNPTHLLKYYYAYMSSKEENSIVENTWRTFEHKDHYMRQSCSCK